MPADPGAYESTTFPNLVVVDKENGGCKADATNGGLNFAMYPWCASSTPTRSSTTTRSSAPSAPSSGSGANRGDGGSIRIVNGCEVRAGRVVRCVALGSCRCSRSSSTCASCSAAWGGAGSMRSDHLGGVRGLRQAPDPPRRRIRGDQSRRGLRDGDPAHRYIGDHRLPYRLRFVPIRSAGRGAGDAPGATPPAEPLAPGLLDTLLRHRR